MVAPSPGMALGCCFPSFDPDCVGRVFLGFVSLEVHALRVINGNERMVLLVLTVKASSMGCCVVVDFDDVHTKSYFGEFTNTSSQQDR